MPYAIYVKPEREKRYIRYDLGSGEYTYQTAQKAKNQGEHIMKEGNWKTYFSDWKIKWVKK